MTEYFRRASASRMIKLINLTGLAMRLEVICQDRLGLVRELLDLLVTRKLDVYGIEIFSLQRLYLRFSPASFDVFSELMAEIRRTPGVTDVRTVSYMPSERGKRVLNSLLDSLPDPVLSVNLKGKVELANPAALQLFGLADTAILGQPLLSLLPGIGEINDLLSSTSQERTQGVMVQGRNFLLELLPLYLPDDTEQEAATFIGCMLLLKSTVRMGQQLQAINHLPSAAFDNLIAESPKMRQVVAQARKLALYDAPLLIIGDTGTGKDILARACHQHSARRAKPYLALNCASLPDNVAESELFGHAAGAYPNALESQKGFFEQANGGSVFLDEIGEMSPRMQIKLLRFLNDGTFRRVGEEHEVHVDVRIICATQKNLQQLVDTGQFRQDLFYRLNVLTLSLPPLSEHPQDIMPLTQLFVNRFADEQGIVAPRLSSQLAGYLGRYHWPGNIRQLKNTIYQSMTQFEGTELRPQNILLPELTVNTLLDDTDLSGTLDEITGRFERSVLASLYGSYPSTRKLANRLGVSHTAIANKLREHGLTHKRNKN